MTAAIIEDSAPRWVPRTAVRETGRLLWIELRHNAMLWMLPVAIVLFWYQAYRHITALPPMWNVRAMTLQNDALLDFCMPVAGAAVWMGWRENRRRTTEMMSGTPWSRWTRHLAAWAATTCWAMVGYLACVAVVYFVTATARPVPWGGPLWWPVVVGAVGIPAIAAFGFVAGVLFPTRFTAPFVTLVTFFGLGYSTSAARSGHSYLLVSPLMAGSPGIGADPGVATFYRYLPDLSIAQVMFLAGATVALLCLLGLAGPRAGSRRSRAVAFVACAAGLAAAGTALGLAGTARLDPHGMTVIPALHDAADDRPVPYTPVCGGGAIPVCLHPAYTAFLPAVTGTLEPVLASIAGLPGVPRTLNQVIPIYQEQAGNGSPIEGLMSHGFTLPTTQGMLGVAGADFRTNLTANIAVPLVLNALGIDPQSAQATPAQQAVLAALIPITPDQARNLGVQPGLFPQPGSQAALAAHRFAALPVTQRHAWLVTHIGRLRAGSVALPQIP